MVRYDAEGEELATWGKRDRQGVGEGFSGCCNPMNVCFGSSGDVYTAESSTGLIKRFSADGEYLDYVGKADLVPGCKNVSIAANRDSSRVYMLDITRSHIVLLEKKSAETDAETVNIE